MADSLVNAFINALTPDAPISDKPLVNSFTEAIFELDISLIIDIIFLRLVIAGSIVSAEGMLEQNEERSSPNSIRLSPNFSKVLSPTIRAAKPPSLGIISANSTRDLTTSMTPFKDSTFTPSKDFAKSLMPSPKGFRSSANDSKEEPPVIHSETRSNNSAPVRINIALDRLEIPVTTFSLIPLTPETNPETLSQNLDKLSPIIGSELLIPSPTPPMIPPMNCPMALPIAYSIFPPSSISFLVPSSWYTAPRRPRTIPNSATRPPNAIIPAAASPAKADKPAIM